MTPAPVRVAQLCELISDRVTGAGTVGPTGMTGSSRSDVKDVRVWVYPKPVSPNTAKRRWN